MVSILVAVKPSSLSENLSPQHKHTKTKRYMTKTKEEQINFIREKCIEANPEIVALKFGCEVLNEVGQSEHVLWSRKKWLSGRVEVRLDGTAISLPASELEEIIGRPIHLADVLKTFDTFTIFGALPMLPQLENILQLYGEVAGMWKLTADDLREQLDETVEFIYKLLTP